MKLAEIAARIGCELNGDGSVEIDGDRSHRGRGAGHAHLRRQPALPPLPADDARRGGDRRRQRGRRARCPRCAPPIRTWPSRRRWSSSTCRRRRRRGIHPTAGSRRARGSDATRRSAPYCVVGDDVVIGDGARLDPHVVIYPEVRIGDDFRAYAHVGRPRARAHRPSRHPAERLCHRRRRLRLRARRPTARRARSSKRARW